MRHNVSCPLAQTFISWDISPYLAFQRDSSALKLAYTYTLTYVYFLLFKSEFRYLIIIHVIIYIQALIHHTHGHTYVLYVRN